MKNENSNSFIDIVDRKEEAPVMKISAFVTKICNSLYDRQFKDSTKYKNTHPKGKETV